MLGTTGDTPLSGVGLHRDELRPFAVEVKYHPKPGSRTAKAIRGRESGELHRENSRPSEPEPRHIAGYIAGDLLDDGGPGGADGDVGRPEHESLEVLLGVRGVFVP